jgi:hypothetical protein
MADDLRIVATLTDSGILLCIGVDGVVNPMFVTPVAIIAPLCMFRPGRPPLDDHWISSREWLPQTDSSYADAGTHRVSSKDGFEEGWTELFMTQSAWLIKSKVYPRLLPSINQSNHPDSLVALSPQPPSCLSGPLLTASCSTACWCINIRPTLHRSSPGFGLQQSETSTTPKIRHTDTQRKEQQEKLLRHCKVKEGVRIVWFSYPSPTKSPTSPTTNQNLQNFTLPPPSPFLTTLKILLHKQKERSRREPGKFLVVLLRFPQGFILFHYQNVLKLHQTHPSSSPHQNMTPWYAKEGSRRESNPGPLAT